MFFERIYDKSLAQASYMIGCQVTGEAIVVDPKRDVDTYIDIAKRNNLHIAKVTETHIHADFLSGARELAELTGAQILLSDEGGEDWQYEFPHIGLKNGDVIRIGNISLQTIHTPGHTPESISFLITDHPATDQPVIILTGDFVFVGDVGRPDLLEKAAGQIGTQVVGAIQMYQSLQQFAQLPDFIQVWPGHGAGSSCGKALGAVASSTVGYEKIRNWALEDVSKEDFVEELLAGQPEPPTYFAKMKSLNKKERSLLTEVPSIPHLSEEQLVSYYEEGAQVIDTRSKYDFAHEHILNTINIQGNNSFANWCGWMLSYDRPIVLITEKDNLENLQRQLMRIGMDQLIGYISSIDSINLPKGQYIVVEREQLKSLMIEGNHQLIDVRNKNEFAKGHIKGAKNKFVGHLSEHIKELDRDQPGIVYCQSGDRATIATSFLRSNGFDNVNVYFGGMSDWSNHREAIVQ